jgi:DNA-binding IclR family transcriptional regulator
MRISEIIRLLNIPRSSAYELIRILEVAEYIQRVDNGVSYTLGRQLHILGVSCRDRVSIIKDGARIAESLRDRTGETVQLCVLDNDNLLVLLKEDGQLPLRIISKIGSRVPVNWGASGRLLVSDMADDELRAMLIRAAKPLPLNRKPVDIRALIRQIREFRGRGWAFEVNEANEHAGCVAAPVLDSERRCVATLSVVVPEQRLKAELLPPLVRAVQDSAMELSRRLGDPCAQ